MTIITGGIQAQNFIGSPYSTSVKTGQRQPADTVTVPLSIDWSTYGVSSAIPNKGVAVSLATNGGAPVIDMIRSIYIDNTNSLATLYVYFQDSQQTIVCPSGGVVCSPVYTNLKTFVIYGTDFSDTNKPTTILQICNFDQAGFYIPESQFQSNGIVSNSAITYLGQTTYSNPSVPANVPQTVNVPITIPTPLGNGYFAITMSGRNQFGAYSSVGFTVNGNSFTLRLNQQITQTFIFAGDYNGALTNASGALNFAINFTLNSNSANNFIAAFYHIANPVTGYITSGQTGTGVIASNLLAVPAIENDIIIACASSNTTAFISNLRCSTLFNGVGESYYKKLGTDFSGLINEAASYGIGYMLYR